MKHFFILTAALTFLCHQAFSQTISEDEGMTLEVFIEQSKTQQSADVMDFDINSDNRLSKNELDEALLGFEYPALQFTDAQKKELREKLTADFIAADQDHDNYLSPEDCKKLNDTLTTLLITYQFEKQDINNDGILNFDDIPSIEESIKKIEEGTKKLEIANQKLQEIPTDQMADNIISNISNSIAKEDYFGMDKNNDGCVNEEEYIAYHLESQERMKNMESEEEYQLTKMNRKDFALLFSMEKKQKPDCLTQEEYIANMQNSLNTSFDNISENMDERSLKEFIFKEMDTNQDNKISKEEFIAFETTEDGMSSSPEDAQKIFEGEPKWEKGWLTKEEFMQIN